jgi:uncharacterized protein YqfA (UPF0365 family)
MEILVVLPVVIIILIVILLNFIPVGLWVSATAAGVNVSIFSLIGMRLRRVRPDRIINPHT